MNDEGSGATTRGRHPLTQCTRARRVLVSNRNTTNDVLPHCCVWGGLGLGWVPVVVTPFGLGTPLGILLGFYLTLDHLLDSRYKIGTRMRDPNAEIRIRGFF